MILEKYRTDGAHYTHVSLDAPKGRFSVNNQNVDAFYSSYSEGLEKGEIFCLAEKPQACLPVLVDVDIKLKKDSDEIVSDKLYTETQVKSVVEIYQSVLRNICEDITDEDLTCVLLEKKMYTVTKNGIAYYKNGFHLHFPYLWMSSTNQSIHLIPRVKALISTEGIFANLGIEDSGSLIDKCACTNPWLLYGSRKNVGADPYIVTKVYDASQEEVPLELALKNYKIYDRAERLIDTKGKIHAYLPRILSIFPSNRTIKAVKHGLISPLKEEIKKRKPAENTHAEYTVNEALDMAERLMPMIADFRAKEYDQWINIGWVLYNISNGDPRGLELWCEFSSRCEESYDEATCIEMWYEKMIKKGLTIGTLRHYAKIDSPEEYLKFKAEKTQKLVLESLKGGHTDIARILKQEYGDEFICGSISNKTWFQFVDHKWEEIEEGVFLREKISTEIVDIFNATAKSLFDKLSKASADDEATLNEKIKKITKIIGSLKSNPFKTAVMKEACDIFYDRRFKHRLDANPFLIAFKNGVYDLHLNLFRPGKPEDYLSKCMPIDFVQYTESDDKVQEVHAFFEKIFPDKSVRIYFLDNASDVFVGGNTQKVAIFWTGEGDNGKSVTQSFFEQMLGPLAIKFNTSLITGKPPGSGAAYPDLARAGGGVRWAILEEPNGDEMINTGTLKHLTGNDTYYARDLFEKGKDGREITPLFKITFICNKLPKLKYADRATWNRVRVIPFESTFCDDYPQSHEEQMLQKRFPKDREFFKKIPLLLSAFAWVLLEHRKNITVRIEPPKVREATDLYRKKNDIYRQFTEEFIEDKEGASLSINDLYSAFKDWYKESLPNHPVPIKAELREYYIPLWGEPEKGSWKGHAFRLAN